MKKTLPIDLLEENKGQIDGVPANPRTISKEEWIVLDVFGGSGTTLMACEQLNRKARIMELDPKYADVIIQRWEEFTGETAELIRR